MPGWREPTQDRPRRANPDSWLRGADTGFTSVTFILDQRSIIRHVHPGGEIVTCTQEPSAEAVMTVADGRRGTWYGGDATPSTRIHPTVTGHSQGEILGIGGSNPTKETR